MYIYIHVYIYTYMYIYIHIYVGNTIINHPITNNRSYKPFPKGWFMIVFPTLHIYNCIKIYELSSSFQVRFTSK